MCQCLYRCQEKHETYCILQLRVLLLGVDEVEKNVERAGEDKGEEETEAGQVHVPLRAIPPVSNPHGT